jgi:hypothetical protein
VRASIGPEAIEAARGRQEDGPTPTLENREICAAPRGCYTAPFGKLIWPNEVFDETRIGWTHENLSSESQFHERIRLSFCTKTGRND